MRKDATVSIEPMHLYGIWTSHVETFLYGSANAINGMHNHASKIITDGVTSSIPFLQDMVNGYCSRANYRPQICFLIDDKFCYWGDITSSFTVANAAEMLASTWHKATKGIKELNSLVPIIVSESSLDQPARWMLDRILPAPMRNQGSRVESVEMNSIVMNYKESIKGETGNPGKASGIDFGTFLGEPDMHQDIRLLCQLFTMSEDNLDRRNPTCTLLAAAWQICRLGLIPADVLPEPIQVSTVEECSSWTSANRTFSILPMSLIAVEHGVRLIISQYLSSHDPPSLSEDIRDRIAYLFLPNGWQWS